MMDNPKMITEQNYKKVLFDFVIEKYGKDLQTIVDCHKNECPYLNAPLDNEAAIQTFFDWLIYEKRLQETGKTIVEEYIETHPEIDEQTRQALRETITVISSRFVVLGRHGDEITIKDQATGRIYPTRLHPETGDIGPNTLLEGRMHKFGTHYHFLGVFFSKNSPLILDPDVMLTAFLDDKIRAAESIILGSNTTLTSILNKYPSNWVNGICQALEIDGISKKNEKAKAILERIQSAPNAIISRLPAASKDALRIVLANDGLVKCEKLKQFDDQISFFWESEMPESTIGSLRVNGLLVIGKTVVNGRKYKIAMIPADIRETIRQQLAIDTPKMKLGAQIIKPQTLQRWETDEKN